MSGRWRARLRRAAIGSLLVVALVVPPARGADSQDFTRLIAEKAPALVTVKFVLKMEGQFGNREAETEITGLMIDPSGLVLCGNSQLGVPSFFRNSGNVRPTDLKVLVGDDTEGLEAKVLARDTELDLAWVKIKDPRGRTFPFVDLSKSAVPKMGEPLLAIRRMAKYFDRAVAVSEGRMGGRTTKPRELIVPGGGFTLEPGLPVFTEDRRVAGIAVIQMPDAEELDGNPLAFQGVGREIRGGLILPAAEVLKATQRAKESPGEDDDSAAEPPGTAVKKPAGKNAPESRDSAKKRPIGHRAKDNDEPAAKSPPSKSEPKKDGPKDTDDED